MTQRRTKSTPKEREYFVCWEIEVYAKNPKEAAKKALEIQRDPESMATHFKIADEKKGWIEVDLLSRDRTRVRSKD